MLNTPTRNCFTLNLATVTDIRAAYIPFIKECGLFLQTSVATFSLGCEINLTLSLLDITPQNFKGKVVWINPAYTQFGLHEGIGIQIQSEQAYKLKQQIEELFNA